MTDTRPLRITPSDMDAPLRCLGVLCTDVADPTALADARDYFQGLVRDYEGLETFEYTVDGATVLGYGRATQLSSLPSNPRDIIVTTRWTDSDAGASTCRLIIGPDSITVTADWCAGVNAFYQPWRSGFIATTNEPALHAFTRPTLDDIDQVSLYNLALTTHHVGPYTICRNERFVRGGESIRYDRRRGDVTTLWTEDWEAIEPRDLSLDEATDAFHDLNMTLFDEAFADVDEVLLPISSGYDSRLIACFLKALGKRTHTVSYGPADSLDVLAGRQVAKRLGLPWRRYDLPTDFLTDQVDKSLRLYGTSMHLHPMYQYPFLIDQARRYAGCASTSGFMTGVPAGQHIRKLGIGPDTVDYLSAMLVFDHEWTVRGLRGVFNFDTTWAYAEASGRWRDEFERLSMADYQRSILGDCFNRQARWISYFPRLYSHYFDTVSPCADVRYTRFLLSLPAEQLTDRRMMEHLFVRRFPQVAKVISNSEGLRPSTMSLRSNLASSFWRIRRMLPEYQCRDYNLGGRACRAAGAAALGPMADERQLSTSLDRLIHRDALTSRMADALGGSESAYTALCTLIPVYDMLRNTESAGRVNDAVRLAA